MTDEKKKLLVKRDVLADPQQLQGRYTNLALVKFTEHEFVLDFIFKIDAEAYLLARLISSPEHTKALAKVLDNQIKKYEKEHGKIKMVEEIRKKVKKKRTKTAKR